ncbi:integrase core domain-containing protein, partial [Acetobacter sp. DmW_125]
SGGKRFDLLLMNSSYLSGRSVSTKPGAIHSRPDQPRH